MDHLSNDARVQLAESGLHMRACEILGISSIEETTAERYADALVKADAEGAGKAYVEKVAIHAGVLTSAAGDKSEVEHRAAVSYLRACGKADYTDTDYVEAVTLIRETP